MSQLTPSSPLLSSFVFVIRFPPHSLLHAPVRPAHLLVRASWANPLGRRTACGVRPRAWLLPPAFPLLLTLPSPFSLPSSADWALNE